MSISDWSSDVCSSDLGFGLRRMLVDEQGQQKGILERGEHKSIATDRIVLVRGPEDEVATIQEIYRQFVEGRRSEREIADWLNEQGILSDLGRSRSEAHTSELESLMRISYAVLCLKKNKDNIIYHN